ncbi:MAG: hypothetical protein AAGA70_02160 [Pseudomonadota bacterium]
MAKRATIDRAGKAALLTELLGQEQMADLRRAGVISGQEAPALDPDAAAWHRNLLIERFRKSGLLGRPSSKGETGAAAKPPQEKARPAMQQPGSRPKSTRKVTTLSSRLAAYLDPDRLADEHPAVLALILKSQPAGTRSEVLRGLPGPQARAVMRLMRAGKKDKPVKASIRKKAAKPAPSHDATAQPTAPTFEPRPKVRTRRAR